MRRLADPAVPSRPVDSTALARIVRRLAAAPAAPWLHTEVARRMGERLALILRTPDSVLQWWGGVGGGDDVLAAAYPAARMWSVEPGAEAVRRREAALRRPWWSARRWTTATSVVLDEADTVTARVGLLWSNMALHWMADPRATFARWKRALADDGFLMFSTCGPDTLAELRALYREHGWPSPAADFVDMHDLGDMLVEAGFADPVMDQEQIVLTWPDAESALAELRLLGGNADPRRWPALRTPRWRRDLCDTLAARRDAQGRIRLRFEIVYGHAFNAPPRAKVTARAEVALDDFRAMTRRPSPSTGKNRI